MDNESSDIGIGLTTKAFTRDLMTKAIFGVPIVEEQATQKRGVSKLCIYLEGSGDYMSIKEMKVVLNYLLDTTTLELTYGIKLIIILLSILRPISFRYERKSIIRGTKFSYKLLFIRNHVLRMIRT